MSAAERSFAFKYPKRFAQKLKSYFRNDKRMAQLLESNNLQVGYFIAREIEKDRERLAMIHSKRITGNPAQLMLRVQRGENLRKRFNQLLKEHHDNVSWTISDRKADDISEEVFSEDQRVIPISV